MADPKQNPTQTPPPDKAPERGALIPIHSISLLGGKSVQWPGKGHATASIVAGKPCEQQFWTIHLDPRLGVYRVAWFAPGANLERPPSKVEWYPKDCASAVPA